MKLKQIHQEYILNHPRAAKTGKSRSELTFTQIAGIRESAFSTSQLFTIADGEEIIRQGFVRWPDIIAAELEVVKRRLVDQCLVAFFIKMLYRASGKSKNSKQHFVQKK